MSNNLEVALTKQLCPVCLKEYDGDIVMNSLLTEKYASQVKELHGKITGFMDHICDECKETIGDGVYIIGCIESKTQDFSNPFRSGDIVGIKKEAAERLFNNNKAIEKQCCYMDIEVMKQIGLIK